MITNYQNIPITKKEIYPTIYDYELAEGWHFESEHTNWGRHIFGGDPLENHYIVKQDEENENNAKKDIYQ